MISVERLLAYGRLESEANLESIPSVMPPSEWPDEGCIEMKDVSFSYSPSGPNVLKNISCLIQPKEKVSVFINQLSTIYIRTYYEVHYNNYNNH